MISIQVRVLLVVFSIITAYGIFKKIRKSACKIADALFWVGMSVLLIVMGCLPKLPILLAEILGIESPVNFVYLIIIFLLLVKMFDLSVKLSLLTYKFEKLASHVAIQENNEDEKKNKC